VRPRAPHSLAPFPRRRTRRPRQRRRVPSSLGVGDNRRHDPVRSLTFSCGGSAFEAMTGPVNLAHPAVVSWQTFTVTRYEMRQLVKLLGLSCGFLMTACGGGDMNTGDECSADKVSGSDYKYATSAIKLPSSAMSYSLDIDGDGRPDNQLKAIIGAVGSAGFDIQGPVDKAVKAGEAVILADVQAADLTMGCSKTTLALAQKPMTPPTFDGSDKFSIDTSQSPAVLYGKITGGKVVTTLPKDQKGDQVQKIVLNLPLADGMLPLTIYGAHVQGTLSDKGVMSGEIHGVIRKTDIDNQIIPAVAQLLTDQIHKDPMGSTTDTIIKLFEDP